MGGFNQSASPNSITDKMDMGLGGLRELVMGQGGLACCGSWGHKELDMTERLNCLFSFIDYNLIEKYFLISVNL